MIFLYLKLHFQSIFPHPESLIHLLLTFTVHRQPCAEAAVWRGGALREDRAGPASAPRPRQGRGRRDGALKVS